MITRGIHEFIRRDWAAARESKDRYWRERVTRLGSAEGLRIGDELRLQAQAQRPGWPHPDDRARDIESHVRLAALVRRAESARCA